MWTQGQCVGGIGPARDVRGRAGKVSLGQRGVSEPKQGEESVRAGEWWVCRGWVGVGMATVAARHGESEPSQDQGDRPCRRGILVGLEPEDPEEGIDTVWAEDDSGLMWDFEAQAG